MFWYIVFADDPFKQSLVYTDSCIIINPVSIRYFLKTRYSLLSNAVSVGKSNITNTLICLKLIPVKPEKRGIFVFNGLENTSNIITYGIKHSEGDCIYFHFHIQNLENLHFIIMCKVILCFKIDDNAVYQRSIWLH